MEKRYALVHSDGSIGIMPEKATLDDVTKELEFINHRESSPENLAVAATVEFKLGHLQILEDQGRGN